MWLLLAIAGCWAPTETSSAGMVGRLLDHTGFPIAEVAVNTLEARAVTDSAGRFTVEYQAPDTHINFDIGVSHFRRSYLPDDRGQVLDLTVPQLREVALVCEALCDARFEWELGPGYTARANLRCEPGLTASLVGVPLSRPELTCRDGEGSFVQSDNRWRVMAVARQVAVSVAGDCRVSIGGVVAQGEDGVYRASASGTVVVRAVCDGQALIPVRTDASELVLPPTATQTFHLGAQAPSSVSLLGYPAQGDSWTLALPVDNGQVHTPQLPAGTYVFMSDAAALSAPPPSASAMAAQPAGELVADDVAGRWTVRIGE